MLQMTSKQANHYHQYTNNKHLAEETIAVKFVPSMKLWFFNF